MVIKYICLIPFVCTLLVTYAQGNELLNHFQKNHLTIESLTEPIDFNLEEEVLENTLLFAQGEVHGIATYERIKLELFKYLYQHANVRVYIVELGASHAFLLNQFMLTGNLGLISGFNESETQLWIDLKKFNDQNKEKIEFLGIDFERNSAIRNVFEIILSNHPPGEIAHDIQKLKTSFSKQLDTKMRIILFEESRRRINKNESAYKEYLGIHFHVFRSIIFNETPVTGTTKRDKYMLTNLNTYHEKHPKSKYFGVFGISHTNRNLSTLIGMLSNDEELPFHENIIVFSPQYMNCETSYGGKTLMVDDYGLLTQERIKKRRSIIDNLESDLCVINLQGIHVKYKKLAAAADHLIVLKNQGKKTN